MTRPKRDHGGGLDAAVATYGGARADWIDLSTGINPTPYPLPDIPARFWQALPDSADQQALHQAARQFWRVPDGADIASASGVSALIAALPRLTAPATVGIAQPTYNEHAASFTAAGWHVRETQAKASVFVHPNNPDGRLWSLDHIQSTHHSLTIIDESFCDTTPDSTHIHLAATPGFVVLKGLGKFWGLAGLRLGFAMATPDTIAKLQDMLGPWAVSGPAQHIGRHALQDTPWAQQTNTALAQSAQRLDSIMARHSAQAPSGTALFRTYHVPNAQQFHEKLCGFHILSRIFPYSDSMVRLGLPGADTEWTRLQQALEQ